MKTHMGLFDSATGEALYSVKEVSIESPKSELLFARTKRGCIVQLRIDALRIHYFPNEQRGRQMMDEDSERFGFGPGELYRLTILHAPRAEQQDTGIPTPPRPMKILITGHAKHGKDTACEILRDAFGLNFVSSSYFVAERAVVPYLAERGIKYDSLEACYADRGNHRPLWKKAIKAYNTPDLARMGRELFANYDVYCGLRDIDEFNAMKAEKLFDVSIWVNRNHEPPEPWSSMEIRMQDCDLILDNNTTLNGLGVRARNMYRSLVSDWPCLNR